MPVIISRQALRRLPLYLQYLKKLRAIGGTHVTATAIAGEMQLNEIQVRKDIASVSSRPGKPMVGFEIAGLIDDMSEFLAYGEEKQAVLVGVGALGSALLGYPGFSEYGMRIVRAFDNDPEKVGHTVHGRRVHHIREMGEVLGGVNAMIGIIAVPAGAAQDACDRLAACGIRAIWNFASAHLTETGDVLIQNEGLASSLAVIVRRLMEAEGAV